MMDERMAYYLVEQTDKMMVRMMKLLSVEMKDAPTTMAQMMAANLVVQTAEMMAQMMDY